MCACNSLLKNPIFEVAIIMQASVVPGQKSHTVSGNVYVSGFRWKTLILPDHGAESGRQVSLGQEDWEWLFR